MRIAQVAPLAESVPPRLYGGTERIVSWLTEELVRQGHEVTLYASGDSVTAARLVPVTPKALRLEPDVVDVLPYSVMLLEHVAQDAARFDVIHFHIDHIQYPFLRRLGVAGVTTMHGRMDLPDLAPLFEEFREAPVISISNAQRKPLPWLNWMATIPHGMPMDEITPYPGAGSYFAFLGRTAPEKGLEEAIEIAHRAGLLLRVAAKVDAVDKLYFERRIKPLLDRHEVEFIGEINDHDKSDFLGHAAALLFPIDWPEPFGLVMIEAGARGTPVLAFRSGSVPEVIEHGVTGIVVDNVDQAIAALPELLAIPRAGVRQAVERRFGVERMAHRYVKVYQRLIDERGARGKEAPAIAPGMADFALLSVPGQPAPHGRGRRSRPPDPASVTTIPQVPPLDRQPTTEREEAPTPGSG